MLAIIIFQIYISNQISIPRCPLLIPFLSLSLSLRFSKRINQKSANQLQLFALRSTIERNERKTRNNIQYQGMLSYCFAKEMNFNTFDVNMSCFDLTRSTFSTAICRIDFEMAPPSISVRSQKSWDGYEIAANFVADRISPRLITPGHCAP